MVEERVSLKAPASAGIVLRDALFLLASIEVTKPTAGYQIRQFPIFIKYSILVQ
jgi:hypothetical protein